jgi:hypothetical protein
MTLRIDEKSFKDDRWIDKGKTSRMTYKVKKGTASRMIFKYE